jgi:chromosome segregation ATPase
MPQTIDGVSIRVENIGGISEARIQCGPGVTILQGRNATNRTSMLQAIMAALGSDRASLKADSEVGSVTLRVGDRTFDRTISRKNGTITTDGDPYLDDPEIADLFAFLLEDNEARRAVQRGDDLRELIMRPVDTDAIESAIDRLTEEKQRIDARLQELSALERKLPELEARRRNLEEDITELVSDLQEKETEISNVNREVEETRETKAKLEEKLDNLRETRSKLEDVRYELETKRRSLESLEEDRSELKSDLESLSETPGGEVQSIEARLNTLHERKQQIESDLNQLQKIIQFNEDMLEGSDSELLEVLGDNATAENDRSITDQLVEDSDPLVCWTCGSTVVSDGITSTVEKLREYREEKVQERSTVDGRIRELQSEKSELEEQRQRRDELERKLDQRKTEIERRKGEIEELETTREELIETVETYEAQVEELQQREHDEILDLHKAANEIEFEIDRKESELAEVTSEIDSIEERIEEREELEERKQEVQDELQNHRTRIEQIEKTAITEFNEHMTAVLEKLDYENIERVWIERVERQVTKGRRKVAKHVFELHVVRETESGRAYEDTVDHLSESEREVVGLVFALAGYLTHDVQETVPFMLLDSLEALDSERIAVLVDYLEQYVDTLIVALLPEDTSELDDSYTCLADI